MIGPNNPGPERAFPSTFRSLNEDEQQVRYGMTLRDYFAAKAMQAGIGLIPNMQPPTSGVTVLKVITSMAYEYADAMLEVRK